ncbi:MAG: hypothetical protein K940chlam9_01934 [Chlamydiae bacterium]|nr:hypothetical protein [Chlamydiota bacterium]
MNLLLSSIRKVGKEEYLRRLEPQAAKVTGVVLGMLAVAPGAMELGRLLGCSQVATGFALYKYPTLGLALTMMTKVEAQAVGSEFQVNTYTTNYQRNPSVASLNDGGFVVTWNSLGQDGDRDGIYGQRYASSGVKSGVEFQVNTYTTSDQDFPSVAPLNDEGFVVTWYSDGQDGDQQGIYGQRYDSNGNPIEPILSNATNTTSTLLSTPSSVHTGTQVGFTPPSPSSGGLSTSPSGKTPTSLMQSTQQISASTIVSFSGPITISGEMIVYEVSYPIVVNGQTVGTYTISGGTGNFTNSNVNVLTIDLEDYQPQDGEVIPLFVIPEGEKEYWESIKIQGEAECIEMKGEVISEDEDNYVFTISFAEGNTCRVNQAIVVPALSLLLKV